MKRTEREVAERAALIAMRDGILARYSTQAIEAERQKIAHRPLIERRERMAAIGSELATVAHLETQLRNGCDPLIGDTGPILRDWLGMLASHLRTHTRVDVARLNRALEALEQTSQNDATAALRYVIEESSQAIELLRHLDTVGNDIRSLQLMESLDPKTLNALTESVPKLACPVCAVPFRELGIVAYEPTVKGGRVLQFLGDTRNPDRIPTSFTRRQVSGGGGLDVA